MICGKQDKSAVKIRCESTCVIRESDLDTMIIGIDLLEMLDWKLSVIVSISVVVSSVAFLKREEKEVVSGADFRKVIHDTFITFSVRISCGHNIIHKVIGSYSCI